MNKLKDSTCPTSLMKKIKKPGAGNWKEYVKQLR